MDSDKKTTLLGSAEGILYIIGGVLMAFFNSPAGTNILDGLSKSSSMWAGVLLFIVGVIRFLMGYYTNKK